MPAITAANKVFLVEEAVLTIAFTARASTAVEVIYVGLENVRHGSLAVSSLSIGTDKKGFSVRSETRVSPIASYALFRAWEEKTLAVFQRPLEGRVSPSVFTLGGLFSSLVR